MPYKPSRTVRVILCRAIHWTKSCFIASKVHQFCMSLLQKSVCADHLLLMSPDLVFWLSWLCPQNLCMLSYIFQELFLRCSQGLSGQCKTILELNLPESVLTTSKGRGTLWVTGPNVAQLQIVDMIFKSTKMEADVLQSSPRKMPLGYTHALETDTQIARNVRHFLSRFMSSFPKLTCSPTT